MTQREQIDSMRRLNRTYREALQYMCAGKVQWSEPQMVTRIGGMPKRMQRVGIVDCSEPFLIVHEIDTHAVAVVNPEQAAQWPWPTVDKFPGLTEFLTKNTQMDGNVNVHVPSEAWARKFRE